MDPRLRMEDDPLGRGTQGKQEEPSFLMSDMPEGAQMGVQCQALETDASATAWA